MDLLTLMDAVQVHAAAAAITASGAKFYDVAVGYPAELEHFSGDRVLNGVLVGQSIIVRGYWPLPETATKRQRVMEGEMGSFVKSLRSRILGDSTLGGACTDLAMGLAQCEQAVIAKIKYAIVDSTIVVEYDETALAP